MRPKRKWDRYEYDVQHHYGLKGKRAVAPPLPCFDVVRHFAPKPAAHGLGGCPFNDLSTRALTRALMRSYPSSLFDSDGGGAIGNGSSDNSGGGAISAGGLSLSAAADLASRAAELRAPTQALNEDGTWSAASSSGGLEEGHFHHHHHHVSSGMSASGAMSLCCKHFDVQHAQAASSRRRPPPPRPLTALLAHNHSTKTLAMHPHQWAQASERLQHEWQHPEIGLLDDENALDYGSDGGAGDRHEQDGISNRHEQGGISGGALHARPCEETGISW